MFDILEYAYLAGGFTTKSDFARINADAVAQAASSGFMTTYTPRDGFGNVWRLTPMGIQYLFQEAIAENLMEQNTAYVLETLSPVGSA